MKPAAESTSKKNRVVVIGLDMGDGELIRAWSRHGHLPNFSALIKDGTWFDLETTAKVLHTSTWPTFATGDQPGRHGVYYPFQPRPGHQDAQRIQPDQYGSPTFWARADQQGLRCIVYDVPETFPESDYNGQAIFEWGTWAWYGQRRAQPESLLGQLKERFGHYPLKLEALSLGLKFPDPKVLEKRLIESIDHKRASFQWLLGDSDWDLAITVFGETHPAGHYLWPTGVAAAPDGVDARFESMRRVYMALDMALGSIRASLPDDVTLIVTSGDGVTANHCGWHLLPEVLERLSFSSAPTKDSAPGTNAKPRISLGQIKDLLPQGARRWIADHLPRPLRDKIGASIRAAQIDWTKSKAFALPTDLEGCVRINLKGREPQGIVEPGTDYDDVCRDIAAQLKELINPVTGKSAVKDVWIRNEVFPGPSQEHLPDITVTWDNSAPINALTSERMGTVELKSPDPRTGTHSTHAFCVAHGNQFPPSETKSGRLIDLAPTVLALLAVEWEEMDGIPLEVLSGSVGIDGRLAADDAGSIASDVTS